LHVYDHNLTFTKLATYSASVVKFNLGVYKSIYTPFRTPLHSRHHQQLENMSKAIEEDMSNYVRQKHHAASVNRPNRTSIFKTNRFGERIEYFRIANRTALHQRRRLITGRHSDILMCFIAAGFRLAAVWCDALVRQSGKNRSIPKDATRDST